MSSEDYDHKTSKLKYKREIILLATAVVALIVLVVSKLPSCSTLEEDKPSLTTEADRINQKEKDNGVLPAPTSQPLLPEKRNSPSASINSGDILQIEPVTLSQQYDTIELIFNSQLKTATLLIDGTEPEIYEQAPTVVKARFRHANGSRKIQLKNENFTCNTSASFSGKRRLSITMSNCESN